MISSPDTLDEATPCRREDLLASAVDGSRSPPPAWASSTGVVRRRRTEPFSGAVPSSSAPPGPHPDYSTSFGTSTQRLQLPFLTGCRLLPRRDCSCNDFEQQAMAESDRAMKSCDGSASKVAFVKALNIAKAKKVATQGNTMGSSSSKSPKRSAMKDKKSQRNKIYTRCCPSYVVSVIEDFNQQKLDIVKQMGFHGLLSLRITKLNRQFGAWLLSKFHPDTATFFDGSRMKLIMSSEDINRVIGVPCKGKHILPSPHKEVPELKSYVCQLLGKTSWEKIDINGLWDLITKRSDGPLDADGITKFKIAFVIYMVTKFLAPQSYNNFISTRYLNVLVDIENVQNYNWAEFISEELGNAAAVLREKLQLRRNIGYINGCIIIPQIFYIDNIDFGKDNFEHTTFPRIGAYDDKNLAMFIERDILLKNRSPFPSFGKLKIRDPTNVCYSRGKNTPLYQLSNSSLITNGQVDHEGIPIVSDPHSGMPLPGDGHTPGQRFRYHTNIDIDAPSFDLGISQPLTQDKDNFVQTHQRTTTPPHASNPYQEGEYVDLVTPIAIHPNSANARSDNHSQQEREYVDPVTPIVAYPTSRLPQSGSHSKSTTLISPHSAMRELSGVKIILREEYSCTTYPPNAKRRIIGEPSNLLVDRPRRDIKPSKYVKSPFLCKQQSFIRPDLKAIDDLFLHTTSIHDEDSLSKIWVHISNPIPSKLNLQQIQEAIRFDTEMQDEAFNVAVQAIIQDELQRFEGTEFVGWRHFLNQDFSMFAAAGEGHWKPEDHTHYFVDESHDTVIPYDVRNCHLIFVPVHHPYHFSLYAFGMKNKRICILDAIQDKTQEGHDLVERHSKTKVVISEAISDCFKLCHPDWDEDIPKWPFEFPSNIVSQENKLDSAFYVLNYMRNWDGSRLVNPVSNKSHDLRKEFLATFLSFKRNEAILPDFVVNCIKASNRK